MILYNHAVEG